MTQPSTRYDHFRALGLSGAAHRASVAGASRGATSSWPSADGAGRTDIPAPRGPVVSPTSSAMKPAARMLPSPRRPRRRLR